MGNEFIFSDFFSTEGISMKYTERQGPQNKNFRRSFPAKEEYF